MNTAAATPRLSKNELFTLFKKQQAYTSTVAHSTVKDRKEKLKRIMAYLQRHSDEMEYAAFRDLKKPACETRASETIALLFEIKYHLKNLDRWMKPQRVPAPLFALGTDSYIKYEPKGTSLIISPWNYPVSLALKPLVAAVSAGCTAIIKPSELAPHTSAFVRSLVSNVFTPEEVAVVEGDKDVGADLLELPFNHIFFTGSPAVGKIVMKAAAANLTSVSLELGGKSPSIIDESADIAETARLITWGKFINNGQTCIAPDYVLVHRSMADAWLNEIKNTVRSMFPEKSPDYGRIINEKHFDRLKKLYDETLANGARLISGGVFSREELHITPTIILLKNADSGIMKEEIFGPVLPVLTFDSIEEAAALVNSMEKPLALYIHSQNQTRTEYLLNNTSSGNVLVNEVLIQFLHPEIPFGGVGNSGMGKSNGFFGFKEFSNAKGVIHRKFGTFKFLYPPYTKRTEKLLGWISRFL